MDIIWDFSKQAQMNRYFFCANNIFNGFYQKLRFYVLPFLPEKFRDRVVYLPKIPLFIRNFKKYAQIEDSSNKFPDEAKRVILEEVENHFVKYKIHLNKLKNEWKRIREDYIEILQAHFSKINEEKIAICPTLFGSIGQYSFHYNQVNIHPRFDRDVKNVCKLIITALTHKAEFDCIQLNKSVLKSTKESKWNKKQKLASRIFSSKEFKSLFSNTKGMPAILYSNFAGNLALESINYLKELDCPIKSELTNSQSIKGLTENEKKVLDQLIVNRNKIITFDDIAEVLWREESTEKFSLYAITKLIERIRRRLRENGITTNLIHTQRKKGYILYD